MTEQLRKIEREVEEARSRLRSDLQVLSSPRTYAAFKEDLKSEANTSVYNFVYGLKARAAANPAAALAIGAGIAWRVIERPPIAAALIGAGLFSLFRTTPTGSVPFEERDYFAEGRQRLTEQVSDFAEDIRDEAVHITRSAASHMGDAAGAAAEKMRDFASAATDQVQESASSAGHLASSAIHGAKELAGELPARAGRMIQRGSLTVEDAVSDDDTRDTLLLGVAGLAVATALGIAFQRATSSTE
jgi:hypothetical protein